MPETKGKGGLVEKGPGDAKSDVRVPTWRGDKGDSSAKGAEETKSVHYDR